MVKKQTVQKQPRPKKIRAAGKKKLTLEDGARGALTAAVVVCVAVLGAGGFFLVRQVLHGGAPEIVRPAPGEAASGENDGTPGGGAGESFDSEALLPELEDAIRALENSAGQSAGDAQGSGPARPAKPAVQPGKKPVDLPAERKGILVFVIDDAGNNLKELDPFLKFPGPLTIAVLPRLPNSAEAAKRILAAEKELFLHQPMEPLGGQDPGPGAVKAGMAAADIRSVMEKNLAGLGAVAGINNHEGSRATMDPAVMEAVLSFCQNRGMVFLDSRTTADTAGPAVSKKLGFPIAQRDVFLDNEQDRDSIVRAIDEGCKKAEQNGVAIMIGHTWSPRLAGILTEKYPELIRRGYFLTTVSWLLNIDK